MIKPIIFREDLIPLIFNGRKTQTRRVQKTNKPKYNIGDILYICEDWQSYTTINNEKKVIYKLDFKTDDNKIIWNPADTMKKFNSRCLILITNVYEQFIQDITTEEIEKEGLYYPDYMPESYLKNTNFTMFWDSIYPNYSFKTNPKVWVYEFKIYRRY